MAADAGHHDAEFNLGVLFQERGEVEEAERWWRKAADAGDVDALSAIESSKDVSSSDEHREVEDQPRRASE